METVERWGVWCTVSGGVTGYREAWLKSHGARAEFPSREAAALEADRVRALMLRSRSVASFTYEPLAIT